jgi:hypothetical protein
MGAKKEDVEPIPLATRTSLTIIWSYPLTQKLQMGLMQHVNKRQ